MSESMRDLISETESNGRWNFQDKIDSSKPIFWYNIYSDESIDFKSKIEEIKMWTTKVKFHKININSILHQISKYLQIVR